MGTKIFVEDKIGSLTKLSATQLNLASHIIGKNVITLGGQQYVGDGLNLSTGTSGFGGIDTGAVAISSFYYVYVVIQNGVLGLIASLSAASPSGFAQYKKVGAFYTDAASTDIFKTYYFGEINTVQFSAFGTAGAVGFSMSPAGWIATQNVLGTGRTEFVPAAGIFSVAPHATASPTQISVGQHAYIGAQSATSIEVRGSNATPTNANEQCTVFVRKIGIDAIQPDWRV